MVPCRDLLVCDDCQHGGVCLVHGYWRRCRTIHSTCQCSAGRCRFPVAALARRRSDVDCSRSVCAGIGTYGYAQLAQQASDSKTWFREAHNQYLETIAEAGVVGAILLMAFCWIAFRTCRMLMRSNRSREAKGWGLAGCLLFMALLIQSFVDFVIVIPANMIVFAAIIGVIVAVYQENMANSHQAGRSFDGSSQSSKLSSIWDRFTTGRMGHAAGFAYALVIFRTRVRGEHPSTPGPEQQPFENHWR